MWCHSLYYHTNFFCLGLGIHKIHICSYCGQQIKHISEFSSHGRDVTKWYHCDCEKAVEESEIQKKIKELQWEYENAESETLNTMPKIDKEMINRMKYEYELTKLKQEYGYEDENILFRKFD